MKYSQLKMKAIKSKSKNDAIEYKKHNNLALKLKKRCKKGFFNNLETKITLNRFGQFLSHISPINMQRVMQIIVIRYGMTVWKRSPNCWCFLLNLEYPGLPYRAYIKTAKNDNFCEELLSENNIDAVLATFCCFDHGSKASEAVQKIATYQKEYRKCSSCVIVCWIAKIYLAINQSIK